MIHGKKNGSNSNSRGNSRGNNGNGNGANGDVAASRRGTGGTGGGRPTSRKRRGGNGNGNGGRRRGGFLLGIFRGCNDGAMKAAVVFLALNFLRSDYRRDLFRGGEKAAFDAETRELTSKRLKNLEIARKRLYRQRNLSTKDVERLRKDREIQMRRPEKVIDVDPKLPYLPETAVVINARWTEEEHTSTWMIERVLESCYENLWGLPPHSPIFLAIDDWDETRTDAEGEGSSSSSAAATADRILRLKGYAEMIRKRFESDHDERTRNIHVVEAGVDVLDVLATDHPDVEYVYNVEHDVRFAIPIDHFGMLLTMENRELPDVNYVLFKDIKNSLFHQIEMRCSRGEEGEKRVFVRHSNFKPLLEEELGLRKGKRVFVCNSCIYSGKNHLVRVSWHRDLVRRLGVGRHHLPESAAVEKICSRKAVKTRVGVGVGGAKGENATAAAAGEEENEENDNGSRRRLEGMYLYFDKRNVRGIELDHLDPTLHESRHGNVLHKHD